MSSNVITLSRHFNATPNKFAAILNTFAVGRCEPNDVYWLKENAEILNLLVCSGATLPDSDLACYSSFYTALPERIAFFPQYYRFFLSMALNLEVLGMKGNVAARLCDFAHREGLAGSELSDLQRAETRALLSQRGIQTEGADALRARLIQFAEASARFAIPNRKLAYELTHIVFYLSEYGRVDPHLSPQVVQSLIFAGLLAHLEQNADLLAEVCVALRFAGETPPTAWDIWISEVVRGFSYASGDIGDTDQYHEYFVTNWAISLSGAPLFQGRYAGTSIGFYSPVESLGTLRAMSEILFAYGEERGADWDVMAASLYDALPSVQAQHLKEVVQSTPDFAAFFQHFARAPKGALQRAPLPFRLEGAT